MQHLRLIWFPMPKYVKKLPDQTNTTNLFQSPQSSTNCELQNTNTLSNVRMQAIATAASRYRYSRNKYSLFHVWTQQI